MKSSTIVLEKHDHADIPWFDALYAANVYAIDGNGSNIIFTAA